MTPRLPVTTSNIVDWVRRCATTVNAILASADQRAITPFQSSLSEPASPVEGQVVYRADLHKPQYYNGSAWVDL